LSRRGDSNPCIELIHVILLVECRSQFPLRILSRPFLWLTVFVVAHAIVNSHDSS